MSEDRHNKNTLSQRRSYNSSLFKKIAQFNQFFNIISR